MSEKRRKNRFEDIIKAINNPVFENDEGEIELEPLKNVQTSSSNNPPHCIIHMNVERALTHSLRILLHVCEPVEPLTVEGLEYILQKYGRNKSMLIAFESTVDNSFIVYWKDSRMGGFFCIEMNNDQRILNAYLYSYLEDSLNDNYAGITLDSQVTELVNKLKLSSLTDRRGFDLLMMTAEAGNLQVLIALLKIGFNVEYSVHNLNAVTLAWKNKHYDVVYELLKANSPFPAKFYHKFAEKTVELKNFIEMTVSFYNCLKANDKVNVERILNDNQNLRHFYDFNNNSARKVAVNMTNLDMYELLLNHNIDFSPMEILEDIIESLGEEQRERMKVIHDKYKKDLPNKHILTLTSNSFVGHDVADTQEKLNLVQDAFNLLNLIPFVAILLKILAAFRNFKIIFDFLRETTFFVDPTSDALTVGVFHTTNEIYIGAKKMLSKNFSDQLDAYATISHEICHNAMNIVYKNKAKPYDAGDKKCEKWFRNVATFCRKHKDKEELVSMVFECYPESMWHAELIVRVPHMLTLYKDDGDRVERLREVFKPLFEYYEEKVLVDLEEDLPEIERKMREEYFRNKRKVRKLRKIVIVLTIFSIVSSCFISYFALFHKTDRYWDNLNERERRFILNSTVSFQGQEIQLGALVDKPKSLTPLQIDEILSSKIIPIGSELKNTSTNYISRNFIVNNEELNSTQLVCKVETENVIIVSDKAGSGKSTVLKNLAIELKREFKEKWISFIDLKMYLSIFESAEKIWNKEILKSFLCDKILHINTDFERDLFGSRFDSENVIFIWNKVDEVAQTAKQFVFNIFEQIKHSGNNQILATRTFFAEELKRQLGVPFCYTFKPLSLDSMIEFLRKYFEANKVENDVITDKIEIFKSIYEKFESKEDLNIPSLVSIYGELLLKCDLKNFTNYDNLYLLYKEYFFKVTNVDLNDASAVSRKEFFEHYALKSLSNNVIERLKLNNLEMLESNIKGVDTSHSFIMTNNSNGELRFSQRIFADFFIAQYLIDSLHKATRLPNLSEIDANLNLLFHISTIEDKVIQNFISEYLKLNEKNYRHEKIDAVFCERISLIDFYSNAGIYCMDEYMEGKFESFLNSYEFLSKFFGDNLDALKALWRVDNIRESILLLAIEHAGNDEEYGKIVKIVEKHLSNFIKLEEVADVMAGDVMFKRWVNADEEILSVFKNLTEFLPKIASNSPLSDFINKCTEHLTYDQLYVMMFNNAVNMLSKIKSIEDLEAFNDLLLEKFTRKTISKFFNRNICIDSYFDSSLFMTDDDEITEGILKIFTDYFDESVLKKILKTPGTEFVPLYHAAMNENEQVFLQVKEFYQLYLKNKEIQRIFENSNEDFFFKVVENSSVETCTEVGYFLNKIFQEDHDALVRLLNRKDGRRRSLKKRFADNRKYKPRVEPLLELYDAINYGNSRQHKVDIKKDILVNLLG